VAVHPYVWGLKAINRSSCPKRQSMCVLIKFGMAERTKDDRHSEEWVHFTVLFSFCQCLERASGTNLVHNQNCVGTNRKFACWQIRKKICWPKVSLLIFVF